MIVRKIAGVGRRPGALRLYAESACICRNGLLISLYSAQNCGCAVCTKEHRLPSLHFCYGRPASGWDVERRRCSFSFCTATDIGKFMYCKDQSGAVGVGCKKRGYRHWVYEGIFWILLLGLLLASGYRYYNRPARKPIEVYDLTWSDKTDEDDVGLDEGDVVYRRWRYYIETKTNLPRKIKKYSKRDPNDDYVLEETLVIEYPADDEIRQVIEDAGFGDLPQGNVNAKGPIEGNE